MHSKDHNSVLVLGMRGLKKIVGQFYFLIFASVKGQLFMERETGLEPATFSLEG